MARGCFLQWSYAHMHAGVSMLRVRPGESLCWGGWHACVSSSGSMCKCTQGRACFVYDKVKVWVGVDGTSLIPASGHMRSCTEGPACSMYDHGIAGVWLDGTRMIPRVAECPHARRIQHAPCTIIGEWGWGYMARACFLEWLYPQMHAGTSMLRVR